jgi:hypothetical protein
LLNLPCSSLYSTQYMSIQLSSLTSAQLRHAAGLKEKIEALNKKLASILGAPAPASTKAPKKRKMSRAGRARVVAAQKARWAKVKGVKPAKKRKMSATAKAKISAAAKARWAKAKAAGKKSL